MREGQIMSNFPKVGTTGFVFANDLKVRHWEVVLLPQLQRSFRVRTKLISQVLPFTGSFLTPQVRLLLINISSTTVYWLLPYSAGLVVSK